MVAERGGEADLGGVLGDGDIPHVVQAVLDPPVPTDEVSEPCRAGLGESEAGDRVDDHRPPPPAAQVAGPAGDLEDLGGVREPEPSNQDGLEGAQLQAAMRAVAGAVQH